MNTVLKHILKKKEKGEKMLAVLLDPDAYRDSKKCIEVINLCNINQIDFIFVGGSLVAHEQLDEFILEIKEFTTIPVVLFPGDNSQISSHADAILLLSLISGRNPEYLIGQHVRAAMDLKNSGLEIIPTGYMLVDGNSNTSVSYVSQTIPIPCGKNQIAISTALAGEQLGMQMIYMDTGSGARNTVDVNMIKALKKHIELPIVSGGGVKDPIDLKNLFTSGSDIVVVGNIFEHNPRLIEEFGKVTINYRQDEVERSIIKKES
ncbi:MAG: geranylgeranylglyceryl/heptaprenylglyceryl phosphate synthase [Bacteroidota bacterium]